jgi:hypothetical protein
MPFSGNIYQFFRLRHRSGGYHCKQKESRLLLKEYDFFKVVLTDWIKNLMDEISNLY